MLDGEHRGDKKYIFVENRERGRQRKGSGRGGGKKWVQLRGWWEDGFIRERKKDE